MPRNLTTKRARRLRLTSLADVSKGEIVRWRMGVNVHSWPELWTVYEKVRPEYITQFAARWPDTTPGIEKLREGWKADGEAGAEAAADELRRLEDENDPRIVLGDTIPAKR